MENLNISKEFTVWCEVCPEWHQESCTKKSTFARLMRDRGWCVKKGKTHCPDCASKK